MYSAMKWKRDPGMKVTDMCKYVDKNSYKLSEEGKYPEEENTIYNYLWLIVKALAIKKRMFSSFQDYDGYSFYAANRLYFAIKKSYVNAGSVIKGKTITPIKSCLNYTKHILYPMKLDYQKETFNEVISEEFVSKKFDAFSYKNKMMESAAASQGSYKQFYEYVTELFNDSSGLIQKLLKKSPFGPNSFEYKRLKISILLNCLHNLKTKGKLDFEPPTIILWKLPKSMSNYVRVLLREFCTELKVEIMECHSASSISTDILDSLITNPGGENYEE